MIRKSPTRNGAIARLVTSSARQADGLMIHDIPYPTWTAIPSSSLLRRKPVVESRRWSATRNVRLLDSSLIEGFGNLPIAKTARIDQLNHPKPIVESHHEALHEAMLF